MSFNKSEKLPPASLLRILAAIIYDFLLLLSVLFFAGLIVHPWVDGKVTLAYQLYLLGVSFGYFAWPWLKSGQTLGMKTWRIQLCANEGGLTLRHVLIRFFAALLSWVALGLGFLWLLLDSRKRSWHDLLSATHLVCLPKGYHHNKPAAQPLTQPATKSTLTEKLSK